MKPSNYYQSVFKEGVIKGLAVGFTVGLIIGAAAVAMVTWMIMG